MKKWKLEIELKVSDNWIEDGFDASERIGEIEEAIKSLLPYAYEGEIKVKVNITEAPSKKEINKMRGYAN